jgi:hypothetical protein
MISLLTREEIAKTPLYKPLLEKVNRFDLYLENAMQSRIFLRQIRYLDYNQVNHEDGNPVAEDVDIGYITRWSEQYRNRVLWKLYNFKGYFERYPGKLPKYSIMGTLTGKHDSPDNRNRLSKNNLGHIAWNEKLWYAKKKQSNMICHYFPENYNISMWEPHPTSGFSHIHTMYFMEELPGDSILKLIANHWSDTLKMGSRERSIELKIKDVRDFKDITSLVGYPMAYIGKNTINGIKDWTAADWVFNASIFWSAKNKVFGGFGHCIRTFQPSFRTSKIMCRDWSPGNDFKQHTEFIDSRYQKEDSKILNQCENYESMLEYWQDIGGVIVD